MGNQQAKPSEKKIEDMNSYELFKKVNEECYRLFNIYKNQFLNKEFCERLAIVYTNEMMNIPIEKVKDIHDKIVDMKDNRGISAMVRYRSKLSDRERFLSNEMRGKLEDIFIEGNMSKSVRPKVKDIELDFPELQYIKPYVRDYLYGKRKRKFMQKGGDNNLEEIQKLAENLPKNSSNNTSNNTSNNISNNSSNNKKTNNKTNRNTNVSALNNLTVMENKNENKNKNKNKNNTNSTENQVINLNLNKKENKNEEEELLKLRNINNEFKPLPEAKKNINHKKRVSSIQEVKKEEIDNYCADETEDCYLTKNEMCKTIVKHMTIRNHLIAAIMSVIPMDDNGEKSFVSQRIKSLQKGLFCLPPKNKISPDNSFEERVKIINQYVKFKSINKDECEKNLGGFFKELTESQFNELKNDNDEISKGYKKYFSEINSYYNDVTRKLLQIIQKLENLKINNKDLMKLVYFTKELIDGLYAKTQENYIMAVMLLMEKNLSKTKEKESKKEERISALTK